MTGRPPSYAWAVNLDATAVLPRQLSDAAYTGLGYAEELARDARTRSNANLRGYADYPPLTIADLAERDQVPAATIRRQITKARRELFGSLSDSTIDKRRRSQEQRKQRPRRLCEQAGCAQRLAPQTNANRRYCDEHRTPAARIRRYRQEKRSAPERSGHKRPQSSRIRAPNART